jgi:3-isopropylmalate dehydrogenase
MTSSPRQHHVAVIDGDGVGPSLVAAALRVNSVCESAFGYHLAVERVELVDLPGGERLGQPELDRLRHADAILKGPAGLPGRRSPLGTETGVLGGLLRPTLKTFANVRPIRSWPGAPRIFPGSKKVDYVIVRENVEGLYASRSGGARSADAAADILLVTRVGTERIARFAFDTARRRGGEVAGAGVTCVDKANVLPSHAFFRSVVEAVGVEYSDVRLQYIHADALAQALITDPWSLDVLVMENFLGDIISELASGTVGGVGMQPSANIGQDHAYFEPAHGTAPSLAGTDRANPVGQILTLALLLNHLGERDGALAVERAVERAFVDRALILDDSGCPIEGTTAAAEAIAQRVG